MTHTTKKAMQINGQYVDDMIPGFYILDVSGRERPNIEIDATEKVIDDGSIFNNRRYTARTISVRFAINCGEFYDSSAALSALNSLNRILDVENAVFIFDDEPDKYYVGTPGESSEVSISLGIVAGSIDIFCPKPYKYSVEEHVVEPLEDGTFVIDYSGSAKSYPTLISNFYSESNVDEQGETHDTTSGKGECGYVSFFNDSKSIIQIGDPDEVDGEIVYVKSQTLAAQEFNAADFWNATSKADWPSTGTFSCDKAFADVIVNPTSACVCSAWSTIERPFVLHTLTLYSSNRTETSVTITGVIRTNLQYSGSYIYNGIGMIGHVLIGGSWTDVTIKSNSARWSGTGIHSVSFTKTISGLIADTTSLDDIYFYVSPSTSYSSCGSLSKIKCSNFAISKYGTAEADKYYLHPTDFANNEATLTRVLPNDSAGETGAINFHISWKNKLCISNSSAGYNELGGLKIQLLDNDEKTVVMCDICKTVTGTNSKVRLYVDTDASSNPILITEYDLNLSYNNKYFGSTKDAIKNCSISKDGKDVVFTIADNKYTYSSTTEINREVVKVKFIFYKYEGHSQIAFNGLHSFKFVKDNCDEYKNIPNKFSANDILVADCSSGEIFLNNINAPSLGALGNDWETFYLKPGINQIGTAYSDWVDDTYKPSFTIKYREVYL